MYTEDDTFRLLRRIPFRDMRSKAIKAISATITAPPGLRKLKLDELFAAHGWTREEYYAKVGASLEGIIIKPDNPYKVHHG